MMVWEAKLGPFARKRWSTTLSVFPFFIPFHFPFQFSIAIILLYFLSFFPPILLSVTSLYFFFAKKKISFTSLFNFPSESSPFISVLISHFSFYFEFPNLLLFCFSSTDSSHALLIFEVYIFSLPFSYLFHRLMAKKTHITWSCAKNTYRFVTRRIH